MTTPWAPAGLFGTISLVAGVTSSLLPETAGKELSESIEKAQNKENQESLL